MIKTIRKHDPKKYYQEHKTHILNGMKRKVHCESCKKWISFCNFPKHLRTTRHNRLLNPLRQIKNFDKLITIIEVLTNKVKLLESIN